MAKPNHAKQQLLKAWLENETVRILFIDDSTSFSFDAGNHEFVADVVGTGGAANEMSGTGYTRKTLNTSSANFVQDDTNNNGAFKPSDTTWSGLDAGTIQAIVIYVQKGGDDSTPGDDPISDVWDDDSATQPADLPYTSDGSNLTINWNSLGASTIT